MKDFERPCLDSGILRPSMTEKQDETSNYKNMLQKVSVKSSTKPFKHGLDDLSVIKFDVSRQ